MISKRVACYARVSSMDQATGLESQVKVLKTYCEQNQIQNVEFFTDEGISGTKSSRPALDRETYRQNGVVVAVLSHGWEFKKLSSTQIEFKNYDQSEEYADIDSGVPHSIPIVRNQVITCAAHRR